MKIKKLARLCAARKSIWVYDGERLQYIGDGSACYTVRGLPELDEESLMVIFDVPEGKRGGLHLQTGAGAGEAEF